MTGPPAGWAQTTPPPGWKPVSSPPQTTPTATETPPPGWTPHNPDPNQLTLPGGKTLEGHIAPSIYQEVESALDKRGWHPAAHATRVLADAASNPLAPGMAVLGALQRSVSSDIANSKTDPSGVLGARLALPESLIMPNVRKEVGNEAYAMFHPNDPNVENKGEEAIGASKLKVKNPKNLTDQARNLGVDMGYQTLTDPLTAAGATGGLKELGNLSADVARVVGDRMLASDNPLYRNIANWLIPHPEERLALTPQGNAAIRGIRQSETMKASRQIREDEDLLKTHAVQIQQGTVPPEVETRLMKDAVIYGTSQLRDEALAYMKRKGLEAPKEWLEKSPEGILSYHLKDEYFPHMGQKQMPQEFHGALQKKNMQDPTGGFQQHQESDILPDDPTQAMQKRLASARAVIRHRMIQKRFSEETGMPLDLYRKNEDKWEPFFNSPFVPEKIKANVRDSAKAAEILAHPSVDEIEGFHPAQAISNIGRDTLIGSNPLPHAKNIGTLTYLTGGVSGLMKGIQYALTGPPKEIADKLEESGAATHFMMSKPSNLSLTSAPGFSTWRKGSQMVLDRIDQGMRAARWEQLGKEFGNKLTDFEKAQKVNEDIGDYMNSPAYVNVAKALGAQFPQWHGYIVPTAMARAFTKNADRFVTLLRGNELANQDVIKPDTGQNVYLSGPAEEASSVGTPFGAASYAVSPSMTGIIGSGLEALAQQKAHPDTLNPANLVPSLASDVIPGINVVGPQLGYNPFHSKAPQNLQSVMGAVGGYTKAPLSPYETMVRNIMENRGVDRIEAEKMIRRMHHRY